MIFSLKKNILFVLLIMLFINSIAQNKDSLKNKIELEEVIISVNKWEQQLNEVPNKITKINKTQILFNSPQTAADLLLQTGTVFIQKSQLGGGSPMIRGFATNRILLVVDGVRMNNAIYRSGNLQNVISIDALSTQTAEVIFGPGSLIYGSDAIGGVIDFHTLSPRFSKEKKAVIASSAIARYSSANNETTFHTDINVGWKKFAMLSAFTYSRFGDLKMGKSKGYNSYLRPNYIDRINGIDSIVINKNPRIQRYSGYNQINFLQKFRYTPSPYFDVNYSFTYAGTGTAPRYDRLIQQRNNLLRFAEWNYGPMLWRMHNLQLLHTKKNNLYNEARLTLAYQIYEESRIDRTRASNTRNIQAEKVNALSLNWDANKKIKKGDIYYGAEYVFNKVGSFGNKLNINNNTSSTAVSRYPNNSTWNSLGFYGSYKINFSSKVIFTAGLRFNTNNLNAKFDTTFIKFPFIKATIKDGAFTGNIGLVYRPTETVNVNVNFSTGYRMPNVDDIGKLFESVPGNIIVPNTNLTSEYAYNFELGVVKNIPAVFRLEVNTFYTLLTNALSLRPATFNGADSIFLNGVNSKVQSLQNVAKATVYGFQTSIEYYFTKQLSIQSHINLITGKETDETKNNQVPLRHAPPFYGSTALKYKRKKLIAEASSMYNSKIKSENLAPTELAKTEIYAKDVNGNPFSPSWIVYHIKVSYQIQKNITINLAWENIFNKQYSPYSSGIVAAGSNFISSVRILL